MTSAALLLLLTSCDPVSWNIEITAKTQNAVRIDLVGINQLDKPEWDALSVDDYWKADNSVRKTTDRLTFEILDGKINLAANSGELDGITGTGTGTVKIPSNHPIWKKWFARRDIGLVVIGLFPGGSNDRPDPRRRFLPLFKKAWDEKGTLRLEIQDNRIQIVTPPSSKASKFVSVNDSARVG